eukprot:CAMPEP_0197026540 /NCGR_PEP_ID=MMETSP1384-20130603/6604_1 /TAXON_ID=29189 /ORGANISM="Ammonia sp." /LENGTH=197 /DNA_ID=CAMNT_0042455225 /DNA_START=19 /DNA_END=612 /DNA_ORIENTATION=+
MAQEQSQRVSWLNLTPQQIEDHQRKKQETEKTKSRQTIESLVKLEQCLQSAIHSLHSAEQNLERGGDHCKAPFLNDIQNYITGLAEMGQLSAELETMAVPIALCDFIDQGKSPDLQMRQNYMVTQSRNNTQRAKIANTYALQKYLENGQAYFHHWSQQKQQQLDSNKHSKTELNDNDNDDHEQEDVNEDTDVQMSKQ